MKKGRKYLDIPEITLKFILYKIPHGKSRRSLLVRLLLDNELYRGITVNREGCCLTKYDKDIKKLMKKKILLLGREQLAYRGDYHDCRSFLFLNPNFKI